MKRIGLIGGISWAATADYYRYINRDIRQRLGGDHSADMVIRSLDLHPLLRQANDVSAIEQIMLEVGTELRAANASLIGVASFTGHRYVRGLREGALPFIDLTSAIAAAVRNAKYQRIAVWATSYALRDTQLMDQLAAASGAQLLQPPDGVHAELDRIVFSELAAGALTQSSTEVLQRLLARQVGDGAQALLLATTDFSSLPGVLDSPVPILDGALIHCAALVDAALVDVAVP